MRLMDGVLCPSKKKSTHLTFDIGIRDTEKKSTHLTCDIGIRDTKNKSIDCKFEENVNLEKCL
jgi:hypothetical protein